MGIRLNDIEQCICFITCIDVFPPVSVISSFCNPLNLSCLEAPRLLLMPHVCFGHPYFKIHHQEYGRAQGPPQGIQHFLSSFQSEAGKGSIWAITQRVDLPCTAREWLRKCFQSLLQLGTRIKLGGEGTTRGGKGCGVDPLKADHQQLWEKTKRT